MSNFPVKFQILVQNQIAPEYQHQGKTYIEGIPGAAYQLQVTNTGYNRVLVIPSVDGLSAINGKPAGSYSQGYIVLAAQTLTIPGWTLNQASVAKFQFGHVHQSYAAKMGDASNVGVIGLMVYEEEPPVPYTPIPVIKPQFPSPVCPYMDNERSTTYTFSSTAAQRTLSSSLGTTFGHHAQFQTESVTFHRGAVLGTLVRFYDTRERLEARGIINNGPNAFPTTTVGCIPPADWVR